MYIIWTFSVRKISLSPLFIYLFVCLFIHLYHQELVYIQFILVYTCSSFGQWEFFQVGFCDLLTCALLLFPEYFLYFLALQDAPGSSSIFSTPALDQPFHQGFLVSFIREWYQKPRSGCWVCWLLQWAWGGVSQLLGLLSGQSQVIYVYILTPGLNFTSTFYQLWDFW